MFDPNYQWQSQDSELSNLENNRKVARWLDKNPSTAYRVSTRVNRPADDDTALTERVEG